MVIVISWSCDRLGRVQNDDIKNFLSPEIALNPKMTHKELSFRIQFNVTLVVK